MTGQTIRLISDINRARAARWCQTAPHGAVVNVRPANRSTAQNARMWAMLSDVSRAKPEGREMTPEVWKALFMSALGHAVRFEPGLDGNGVVPVGFRSSRLTKEQMGDLMTVIEEYGARHGVQWSEPNQEAA